MFPYHHIRLQIGIGGRLFVKPMPEHFDELHWKCPALIVDYVRIFEKIPQEIVTIEQLSKCKDIAINNNKSSAVINDICEQSINMMKEEKELVVLVKSNWRK